ncbi:MAG TPA: HlyD family efflux transporter periplasmic adaptor subunit [Burkholderiaceae bacterium]|nr:HlyD family efflux transporter periplasmic adaptor subunit [Burkholderiaceae bacterium]
MKSLFRQEAIDAQREKLLGAVSVARPLPLWIITCIAVAFAAALIVFAFWGEYTRRERVEGFLTLDSGAARILAPAAGRLAELLVREGQEVTAGAPIARLSLERATRSGPTSSELVQRELQGRAESLESERQTARRAAEQELLQARTRIAGLQNEIAQLEGEIKLQDSRVASAHSELRRTEQLVRDRFLSDSALSQKNNELLEQQSKLQSLRRNRAGFERELAAARAELGTIDLRLRQQLDQLTRQRSEVQQDLVQEQARRELLITAPVAGTVTNIAVSLGDSIGADAPIAIVLPHGSGLRAQLLVPTRAIGFIQPGNDVVLRYEAFPFQRFGQFRGDVDSVARTVWSAGERIGPLVAREPVYRVDVSLERQTVPVGEQEIALRPGMMLSADILLERRTVFEWVFEPVLEWRSRLQ